jgi:hypothetical protein
MKNSKSISEKNQKEQIKESEKDHYYLNDEPKDFSYSDYVSLRSGAHGILFSFGQSHPEKESYRIIEEILIPYDVALALRDILDMQFVRLEEKGLIKVEKKGDSDEK